MSSIDFYSALLKKEEVAKDTVSFFFDRKGHIFDFYPGQYISMILPIIATDGKGASRFFTIASSPLDKDCFIITTKKELTDFKKKLFEMKPGTEVHFFGPIGGFYLCGDESSELVFLAGGIGITPFYSMIKYIVAKRLLLPITLLVAFSTREEMIYYDELTAIAQNNQNIKVIYTITHPNSNWNGEIGRISESLIRKHVNDITKPIFYIVGPPQMVMHTEELLGNMGIADEKIRIEQFTGY